MTRGPLTTETALGLYRMYAEAMDGKLEEIGCTRDDILRLARFFDTGVGSSEANIALSARFRFQEE